MIIKAVGFQNPAIKMVTALSEMLRISMESKEYLIPLCDEIIHCKSYLDIMKIRYSDKLNIEWKVSGDLLQYKAVKLSLQPIIENAVYHGIKPKKDKGKIVINAYYNDGNILVEIIDDGIGMPKDKIDAINATLNNEFTPEEEHVGIANVNKRIKLIFGSEYGVLIDENWEIGTRVIITIPAIKNT